MGYVLGYRYQVYIERLSTRRGTHGSFWWGSKNCSSREVLAKVIDGTGRKRFRAVLEGGTSCPAVKHLLKGPT
jgi:hypothetical protein